MSQQDAPRWLVLIDGPSPMGKWFTDRKRAERFLRRQKAKGLHAQLADLSKTFADMEPEEIE